MWLDASIEKEYAKEFGYENENIIVVLNPGKRKRFVTHEGGFTFSELKTTLERINGGDGRFKKIDLPA